jgi:capsular exopolysaccharide synthesis family protein
MAQYIESEISQFYDILAVIRKRKILIFLIALIVFVCAGYLTYIQQPVYQASTKVYYARNATNQIIPTGQASPYYYSYVSDKELLTQQHIIYSSDVLNRVANALNLSKADEHSVEFENVVKSLRKQINVELVADTNLLLIKSFSNDPIKARDIANTLAQSYIKRNYEKNKERSKDAIVWLTDRIASLESKLKEAEKSLLDYQEKNRLINVENPEQEKMSGNQELRTVYLKTKTDLIETQVLLKNLNQLINQKVKLLSIPPFIKSRLISELDKQLVQAELEFEDMSVKYLPMHPKMIKAQQTIDSLQNKIRDELMKIRNQYETQYHILQEQEQNLAQEIQQIEQSAINDNRKAIEYSILKREADTNRELYNVLVKKLKELDLSAEITDDDISIIEYAQAPTSPVKPRKMVNLSVGLLAGIFLGFIFAFLIEYLDRSIKSDEEAASFFNMPVLATVPKMKMDNRNRHVVTIIQDQASKKKFSHTSEAFRALRTNLKFSTANPDAKTFLITSTGPQEGKSMVASNLGVTMAQTQSRTLIVDTDLRKPTISKYFKLDRRERGLSNYLVGDLDNIDEAIVDSGYPNLFILPTGPRPPNPVELLDTARMRSLVEQLRQKFDYVIFDSPPVNSVIDASIISSMVDGVLFILFAGKLDKHFIRHAVDQLITVKAKIYGIVINGMDYKHRRYRYYSGSYRSGYGYGYGSYEDRYGAAENDNEKDNGPDVEEKDADSNPA